MDSYNFFILSICKLHVDRPKRNLGTIFCYISSGGISLVNGSLEFLKHLFILYYLCNVAGIGFCEVEFTAPFPLFCVGRKRTTTSVNCRSIGFLPSITYVVNQPIKETNM